MALRDNFSYHKIRALCVGRVDRLRPHMRPVVAAEHDDVPAAPPFNALYPVRDYRVPADDPIRKRQNVARFETCIEPFARPFPPRDKFDQDQTLGGNVLYGIRADVGLRIFFHRRGHDEPRLIADAPADKTDDQNDAACRKDEQGGQDTLDDASGAFAPVFCFFHSTRDFLFYQKPSAIMYDNFRKSEIPALLKYNGGA